jgi:hypothetical protein
MGGRCVPTRTNLTPDAAANRVEKILAEHGDVVRPEAGAGKSALRLSASSGDREARPGCPSVSKRYNRAPSLKEPITA